jgi:parvulin-like peptidyl-prolyl isomerase
MAKSPTKPSPSGRQRPRRRAEAEKMERQTKKQIAMGRKQARQNRIIVLSLLGIGAVVLLVLAAGLLQELAFKPSQPVAIVDGTKISVKDYLPLLRYQRYSLHKNILSLQSGLQNIDPNQQGNDFLISFYQQQLQQLQDSLSLAPQNTLDELIDQVLIQEKADEQNITVTNADVQQYIDEQIRQVLSPATSVITGTEGTPTPTPVTDQDVQDYYKGLLVDFGITDNQFQDIVRRDLYRTKVGDYLASQVLTTGLVIHVQLIQTDTEDQALAASTRIEGGEDFAVVAQEVSTDTVTAQNGGDLGWITTGQLASRYGQEVEDLAFSMQPGELDTTSSGDKFYVIQVSERDENGPLPQDVVTQRKSTALDDWLTERRDSPDVTIERLLQPDQIPSDPFATPVATG